MSDTPLRFNFYNEQKQAVLYMTEHVDQKMTLEISNTSKKATTLLQLTEPISATNHHFELIFRAGTINHTAIKLEDTSDFELFINRDHNGKFKPSNDGSASLYFKSKSSLTMQEGQNIKIKIANLRGNHIQGAHATLVMLKYQNLLHAGDSTSFSGHTRSRLLLLEIERD
ncbi:MAG: hypothetical protein Sapg2KO_34540 [Saprospiraceae bacterium]